ASNSNDLWDLFLFVTGLFGVPLAGVFAVGIFTKRTNTFGVICGLILGIIFAYVYNGVGKGNSPFYVSTISFTVAFVFAYILSFIVPSKHKKDITGLTIFEKDKPSTYISKTATKK
ncbi:TPA: Na+/proline symporter, partial [Staphylococcus aureus]|nr:Na+/proline symporter [Staphylococcus aureus]